jgi:hypothetical protein
MKKFICCISLLLLSVLAAAQMQTPNAVPVPDGVRLTETAAHSMLVNMLKDRNVGFYERNLMAYHGAFGVSIEARFPARPDSKNKSLFVLAVPVSGLAPADSKDGDLTWGHELALSLIDKLLLEPQPFETLVCFTADNWPAAAGAYPYAGLQELFSQLEYRENTVLVYCEFPEQPAALSVVRQWGQAAAPLELVAPFFQLCAETGTPCFFETGNHDAEDMINERGDDVPVLYITTCSTPVMDIAEKISEELSAGDIAALLYSYAANLMQNDTAAQPADRNYLYIGFEQRGFFISEYAFVLITLFGFSFITFLYFLLCAIIKSRRKLISIRVFGAVVILTALFLLIAQINSKQLLPYIVNDTAPSKIVNDEPSTAQYFTVSAKSRRLLEREIININIDAMFQPLRYRLFFTAGDISALTENTSYFIYDAPVPYAGEAGRIEFTLGSYPPNPLNLEIALPLNLDGEFTIEAFFEDNVKAIRTFTPDK